MKAKRDFRPSHYIYENKALSKYKVIPMKTSKLSQISRMINRATIIAVAFLY